jgi:CheY-like chemotaxis protein
MHFSAVRKVRVAIMVQMPPARILVIEDNANDIVVLRYALDQHGEDYELEILRDGEEALKFIHEHRTGVREPEPCVILLDLYLPVYDGLAVLRAIRGEPVLEHINVVVLTSLASPRQELEISNMGAVYKKKPSHLDDVVKLAAEVIEICKNSSTAVKRI